MDKQAAEQADRATGEEIRGGQGQDTTLLSSAFTETFVPSSLKQTISNEPQLHQMT